MNVKKRCKLKSANRLRHYQSFGWLKSVVYRLRNDKIIRHYLKTGKYVRITSGSAYELFPGGGCCVKDLFITSKVKRSRIKNIPDGCVYVGRNYETV